MMKKPVIISDAEGIRRLRRDLANARDEAALWQELHAFSCDSMQAARVWAWAAGAMSGIHGASVFAQSPEAEVIGDMVYVRFWDPDGESGAELERPLSDFADPPIDRGTW